jgi:hypothetical protein
MLGRGFLLSDSGLMEDQMTQFGCARCAYPGYDLAWGPAHSASIREGGHDVMQSPASGIPVRRRIE